jgi:multisubunit Na+/H+ antiporter MnhG subunit
MPLGFVLAAFALFAAYSLPHVYDPPIGTHGWRQAIATSEARMYAAGTPFLYPRAEGCGAEPNVFMGSEFPLYAWTMGKLGGAVGVNFVGRLMGLLSALALMLASFVIVRFFFRRWKEPYRSVAAAAAGTFFAVSPLFRFYGISFVPDLEAHALTLVGVAVFIGPLAPAGDDEHRPLSLLRFLVGALLISLGCMTKLSAVPHLALAGVVLLDRARPREGLEGFKTLRPWLMAALLLAIVAVPVWAWYIHWVPVLKKGGCEMVWLPEKMDDTWKTMTFTDPEWRFRMAKWGREDLLGPAWIACLAGLPLLLSAGLRGGLLLLWSFGCMLGYVRLGWHTKQHDYDFLLALPAFAMGFGTSFGLLARLLAIPAEKLKILPRRLGKWVPFLALAIVVAVLSPGAHKQSRRHFYTGLDEVGLKDMVDKVLPRGEPIHYVGGRNDPRVPFFAARLAWGTELWQYCQKRDVKYDCLLATGTDGRLSPCVERLPAVAWQTVSLVCGITRPQDPIAPARVLETLKTSIRFPADLSFPGVGRLLGTDPVACGGMKVPCAGNLERKEYLDVYFLAEANAPQVELLADGKSLALLPPPARWIAGTVMVARAELPATLPQNLELKVKDKSVPVVSR